MKKTVRLSIIVFILISFINLSSCKGHQHTFDEGVITKESTCTTEGIKEYKCTKCEEIRQETIKKLEHIYETTIVKSTCSEKGSETKVCKLCNDTKEKELEKIEHNYIEGKCTKCYEEDPDYVDINASRGLTFELNEEKDSYIVTGIGTCTDTNLIIPRIYKGLPVTSIKDFAFIWCDNLVSVEIPNSITNIGGAAFGGCRKIESVKFQIVS